MLPWDLRCPSKAQGESEKEKGLFDLDWGGSRLKGKLAVKSQWQPRAHNNLLRSDAAQLELVLEYDL